MLDPDARFIKEFFDDKVRSRGKSKQGLARAMGMNRPSGVTDIISTGPGKTPRKIKKDEVPLIEAYLGAELPSTVARTRSDSSEHIRSAPVRGSAAAGQWLEYDGADHPTDEDVPYVRTRYGNLEQFAYKIVGSSMEKERIFDGDYVICVPYSIVRAIPAAGDIVVAERRAGGLLERSCKKVEGDPRELRLMSRSDDPQFRDPISLGGDGAEVELVGLVVGTYRPRF